MALRGSAVSLCALTWHLPRAGGFRAWGGNPEQGGEPSPTPRLPWRKSLVALGSPCECDLKEQFGIFFTAWGESERERVSYSFPSSGLRWNHFSQRVQVSLNFSFLCTACK